ncbi:hypothetical protein AR457_20940 [Streptomyces agglomeratus]|uniref:hypothetical protein n=1 Tax=Streptomyces agglomeratus TaxID=285458 RepID=UPI0008549CDD|nr:hypothetical protein [Streptomyces agglomeratus]OEJ39384.1 hypothetical protein BGK70_15715 [Streptomyces agglomeratus]OEJ46233.1 hypothetical protein AR457_20940 [Streptomyces agglomeratus]OEJ51905.1 hypothetical protein BGK72_15155 [Streptomyces agglomeratus]OEJ59308.1 hypothetical protein BGM19_16260 [Streptomyces agglomeratus]
MLDTTPLTAAVDRFADRLRAAPQSRLQRGAAAEGLALARELSVRAQRIEEPGREPRIMPDAGAFAVADQLAVAGHDLAKALETSCTPVRERQAERERETAPSAEAGPETGLDEAVRLVKAAAARAGF